MSPKLSVLEMISLLAFCCATKNKQTRAPTSVVVHTRKEEHWKAQTVKTYHGDSDSLLWARTLTDEFATRNKDSNLIAVDASTRYYNKREMRGTPSARRSFRFGRAPVSLRHIPH